LAALLDSKGLIELFLRDRANGNMQHMVQTAPGSPSGDWTKPIDLGIRYVGRPAVALNGKAGITVAAVGQSEGTLWLREEGRTMRIAQNVASAPALLVVDGTLYLAARAAHIPQSYLIDAKKAGKWAPATVVSSPPPMGGGAFGVTAPPQ
jgi:hypothetical protein